MENNAKQWNSAYWIDHLAKITDKTIDISERSNDTPNTSSPSMSSSQKTDLLVDISDSSPSLTKDVSIKFSDLEIANTVEQSVGEPDISSLKITAQTPQKLTDVIETEQINCTLTDLVLGMESKVIRDAYNFMDDQVRRNAYIADNAPVVTFASLIEESKQQKKTVFNVDAFEFKPSYHH